MTERATNSRLASIGGTLIAAKPLAQAMGGLGWMAQGGKRIGLMLRAMTKEAPPPAVSGMLSGHLNHWLVAWCRPHIVMAFPAPRISRAQSSCSANLTERERGGWPSG